MEINLSAETITTVYNLPKANRHSIKWDLEVKMPHGKVNPTRKPDLEKQLADVEDALFVFEELMGSI